MIGPAPHMYMSSISSSYWATGNARAMGLAINTVSADWPLANRAIYVPFTCPWRYPIRYLFWANGSTTGNNMNVGIYSDRGGLLIQTGSTARTTSLVQYVAVDFVLPPGAYYFAQICSGTTGMIHSLLTSYPTAVARMQGLLQEDVGSMTLPNAMTPAQFTSSVVPVNGFTMSAVW